MGGTSEVAVAVDTADICRVDMSLVASLLIENELFEDA